MRGGDWEVLDDLVVETSSFVYDDYSAATAYDAFATENVDTLLHWLNDDQFLRSEGARIALELLQQDWACIRRADQVRLGVGIERAYPRIGSVSALLLAAELLGRYADSTFGLEALKRLGISERSETARSLLPSGLAFLAKHSSPSTRDQAIRLLDGLANDPSPLVRREAATVLARCER